MWKHESEKFPFLGEKLSNSSFWQSVQGHDKRPVCNVVFYGWKIVACLSAELFGFGRLRGDAPRDILASVGVPIKAPALAAEGGATSQVNPIEMCPEEANYETGTCKAIDGEHESGSD